MSRIEGRWEAALYMHPMSRGCSLMSDEQYKRSRNLRRQSLSLFFGNSNGRNAKACGQNKFVIFPLHNLKRRSKLRVSATFTSSSYALSDGIHSASKPRNLSGPWSIPTAHKLAIQSGARGGGELKESELKNAPARGLHPGSPSYNRNRKRRPAELFKRGAWGRDSLLGPFAVRCSTLSVT